MPFHSHEEYFAGGTGGPVRDKVNARPVLRDTPVTSIVQQVQVPGHFNQMPADSSFAPLADNPSMPAATVIPVLLYPDVPAGATWLCDAFGAAIAPQCASARRES